MKRLQRTVLGTLLGILSTTVLAATDAGVSAALQKAIEKDIQPSQQIDFPHQNCFEAAAKAQSIPTALLLAVARGESDFNARAVSTANAYGVMQLQWPGTAKDMGISRKEDLFKPCLNIHAGAKYLRYLLDRYDQDTYLALAAYNYGPGRIKKSDSWRTIPKGAKWYAGYIYDHLTYVSSTDTQVSKHDYSKEQKIDILIFKEVFRAEAFVAFLKKRDPSINMAWFRRPFGEFHVVLQFRSEKEKRKGIRQLQKLGFHLS